MTQIPIADGLYAGTSSEPRILGSRCSNCGDLAFPARPVCARCTGEDVAVVELADVGTIWTWTSQEFRPPSPPYTGAEDFTRYYVGFVETADGLVVESHLTGFDDRSPAIGEAVSLTMIPFRVDDDGNERMIHAFTPAPANEGTA